MCQNKLTYDSTVNQLAYKKSSYEQLILIHIASKLHNTFILFYHLIFIMSETNVSFKIIKETIEIIATSSNDDVKDSTVFLPEPEYKPEPCTKEELESIFHIFFNDELVHEDGNICLREGFQNS